MRDVNRKKEKDVLFFFLPVHMTSFVIDYLYMFLKMA
jgi:hypothetical protein